MKILTFKIRDIMNKEYDSLIHSQLNSYMQDDTRNIPYIKEQLFIQIIPLLYIELYALLQDQLSLESQSLVTEGNSLYSV